MTEYTVLTHLPDINIAMAAFELITDRPEVNVTLIRTGQGTWLSYGLNAETDAEAVFKADEIRYAVSQTENVEIPGYDAGALKAFETAPMIVTSGRSVISSVGV